MMKRILIVEDDLEMAGVLLDNLVFEGFAVESVGTGPLALQSVAASRPDLVLLDAMLPGLSGFDVCRMLSADRDRVSIIMLTARSSREDRVRGLELGADDYVTKPFALDELLARIHAVLRRTHRALETLSLGDVRIDFAHRQASNRGGDLPMTARELAILQHLAERAGKVVSREELLQTIWGYKDMPLTRTVDNFVARLRRKIERDPHNPRFLHTVHGDGYSLTLET